MNWEAAFAALGWVMAIVGILGALITLFTISDAYIWAPGKSTRPKWRLVMGLIAMAMAGVFLAAGLA